MNNNNDVLLRRDIDVYIRNTYKSKFLSAKQLGILLNLSQ
ncbi:hypothetical protein AHYW_003673 [Providencia manganoxydans]